MAPAPAKDNEELPCLQEPQMAHSRATISPSPADPQSVDLHARSNQVIDMTADSDVAKHSPLVGLREVPKAQTRESRPRVPLAVAD